MNSSSPGPAPSTWNSCVCSQAWWGDACGSYCCNPDSDPLGAWCIVVDEQCEGSDWGYCRPLTSSFPGCTDARDWTDSHGVSCYVYEIEKYCDGSGGHGTGWSADWGTFDDYAGGQPPRTAADACCGCGGGDRVAPASCADRPEQWVDSEGNACSTYQKRRWCNHTGGYDLGWHEEWGSFAGYAVDGDAADEACCVCGGGTSGGAGPAAAAASMWTVTQGKCTIDRDGCAQSPNYPGLYPDLEACLIQVYNGNMRRIHAVSFVTEKDFDKLSINGVAYSGDAGPQGIVPIGMIKWEPDDDESKTGWKLCPEAPDRPLSLNGGSGSESVDVSGGSAGAESGWMYGIAGMCVLGLGVTVGLAMARCHSKPSDDTLKEQPTEYGRKQVAEVVSTQGKIACGRVRSL